MIRILSILKEEFAHISSFQVNICKTNNVQNKTTQSAEKQIALQFNESCKKEHREIYHLTNKFILEIK